MNRFKMTLIALALAALADAGHATGSKPSTPAPTPATPASTPVYVGGSPVSSSTAAGGHALSGSVSGAQSGSSASSGASVGDVNAAGGQGGVGAAAAAAGDSTSGSNLTSRGGDTRAIGTRVSQAVYDTVLGAGQTWLDRAFVVNDWYVSAYQPLAENKISVSQALEQAAEPLKGFMLKQTRQADLALFIKLSGQPAPQDASEVKLRVLVPAFVTSELKTAFQIGFLLFLPFVPGIGTKIAGARAWIAAHPDEVRRVWQRGVRRPW